MSWSQIGAADFHRAVVATDDLHRAMVATAAGEKLLTGHRPV